MNTIRLLVASALLCVGSTGTTLLFAANAPILPVEDFVRLPDARDVQISPGGQYLSIVFRRNGEEVLAILNSATREIIRGFNVSGKGKSVGNVAWVGPERLVYGSYESLAWDKRQRDTGEMFGVNADGSRHELLFGPEAGEMQTGSHIPKRKDMRGSYEIIDLLPGDKKNILIVFHAWKVAGQYYEVDRNVQARVLKLNVYNGRTQRVVGLQTPLATAITDTEGRVRFSIGTDKNNEHQLAYREIDGDQWKDFPLGMFHGAHPVPISFAADNQHVYLAASVDGGTRALYLVNLQDQSFKKVFQHALVDTSHFIQDFAGKKLVAVGTELGATEYHYLDGDDAKAKIHRSLKKAFSGQDILITSETDDGKKVVVFVYSDLNPGEYYLFGTASMKAEYLVSERSWIKPDSMAHTEPMTFETRDGLIIHGYLTRPVGATDNMPLIVMPHGGPHSVRDYWGFDWETQLLANRGYAVLRVNFRGSGGFGNNFEQQGYGEWGALMQDDITDATRALIASKLADPNRICIFGSSFGAYAAMMGAVREPDLYQCAIGAVGIYDLPMMFAKGDISDRVSGTAYLRDVLGQDTEDQKRRSPVYNAGKIKADVLLIHGARDERAPIRQAKSLMNAFDRVEKSYEWLQLGDEGHGFYDEDNRLKVYTKVLDFIADSIGK